MEFISTRGFSDSVGFTQAVAQGLAPDGGLYLPKSFPDLSPNLKKWEDLAYDELCFEFFKLFATDMNPSILKDCVNRAYSGFSVSEVAPIVSLSDQWKVLELFHGPTLAFKDFALQLLGNFYEAQIEREGKPLTVLGATSGDTGAAAISGLVGKKGVEVFILYPNGKVSPLQERQMTCTGASNVYPIAIEGTFDDAQRTVKEIFADLSFRDEVGLSAVNSINLARILAQSVYYLFAWLRLKVESRTKTTFVVPTGNFGNVFAGWLLTKMGIEISEFRVATNQNDVLHQLFKTGEYALSSVRPSLAPSMDIQVASNFERLLYFILGKNSSRVQEVMKSFRKEGKYCFEKFVSSGFSSCSSSDLEIPALIQQIWDDFDYLVDPHTACAFKDLDPKQASMVLATAHPAKFPSVYEQARMKVPRADELEALLKVEPRNYQVEVDPDSIRSFIKATLMKTS
ncbi:MAG: threonine synthase [Verrucomicrobiota bacterium]|nr:threonine synthase [Verrucomicrobiota bacterium]